MSRRILGLDVGKKRIGLALSDPQGIIASPLMVMERGGQKSEGETILELIQKHDVGRIVVGLPLSLDGSSGREVQRVQDFVRQLSQRTEIPIDTWDERLSTLAAERALVEGGMRREERKIKRDAVAAALMLQSYLDRIRSK